MAVTENLMAAGTWSVRLKDVPQHILDRIGFFNHIAVTESPEDIRLSGDGVLASARYVGVLRGREDSGEGLTLSGAGMAVWLGDEEGKGAVIETLRTYNAQTLSSVITDLLAGTAIKPGTLHSVTGLYSGTHQWVTPRKAIDYVTSTMNAEWRVRGDGYLDVGQVEDLYPTEPRAGIFAKARGTSQNLKALPGAAKLATDVQDLTTRVVLLAEGEGISVATGSADVATPHVDIHGDPVKLTRVVSESGTSQGNATVRAQLQLNRFVNPRDAVTLNSTTHDIVAGSVVVGENVWVYDPEAGLYDNTNEVQFQGETLNPALLRVTAMTWPITEGRGVYLRTGSGEWIDLTPFVTYESGQVNVTVGGYSRSLVTGGESVGTRAPTLAPNTSVPAAPVWSTPFRQTVYQSPVSGVERAQVELEWTQPLNIDGTAIIDGDFYEIRYRTTSEAVLPATHTQMSQYSHDELNTHDSPIPFVTGAWAYVRAPWDVQRFMLGELAAGVPYEYQIRAFDNGTPANVSEWSASVLTQTPLDNIAPEAPAAPFVAGNRMSVQVMHRLGGSTGGEFNLPMDLHHLEVHAEYEPNYEPRLAAPQDGGTMIGLLSATEAELRSGVPVVGSFAVDNTEPVFIKLVAVDRAGNRSRPSLPAQVSVLLVDDAHITNLSVSKVDAGEINAQWVNGGLITTNASGVGTRVGMDGLGFFGIDSVGDKFFSVDEGGAYMRGTVEAGIANGRRITVAPSFPAIQFWLDTTQQRYVLQPYTSDQPDDPADAPGLQLYGRNEIGEKEGARAVWYEDGWYMQLLNQQTGGVNQGTKGGYIFGFRSGLTVGYEDDAIPDGGYYFFPTINNFQIRRKQRNGYGGYIYGGDEFLNLQVRDSGDQAASQINLSPDSILVNPGGSYPGRGWWDIRFAPNVESSPQLRMLGGNGSGILHKNWNGQAECRRWDDAVWATFACDVLIQASDERGKKEIRDLERGGLDKVKKLKPRKYRRPVPATEAVYVDRFLKEDTKIDGIMHPAGSKIKDKIHDAVPAGETEETLGLIAQEVPAEWTRQTSDGLGINLYAVVTTLVQAIQEQAEVNDAQADEITALREQVGTLESQMAEVLKALKIDPKTPKKEK